MANRRKKSVISKSYALHEINKIPSNQEDKHENSTNLDWCGPVIPSHTNVLFDDLCEFDIGKAIDTSRNVFTSSLHGNVIILIKIDSTVGLKERLNKITPCL